MTRTSALIGQMSTVWVRHQEAAAPASGGKRSVARGELPAQTPASQRPLPASRVPDALPADWTGKPDHLKTDTPSINDALVFL